jgi:hypothetical protein
MRRLLRREDGQAAFEFILILPLFVLWMLLLVDLGIMTYEYVSLSNAVREGARYGAVNCGDGSCTGVEVRDRAIARSGGLLTAANAAEVTVGWISRDGTGGNSDRGDSVVVKVNHPYPFLFFPVTFPVVSCADMRLEQRDVTSGLPAGTGC